MSRTLFWYILKDLLRIFLLTSAGLAGIMSFGGLLRPLTEHGLNAGQVGTMLACFVPAMTTYSFPVAALFATSMVYGRLSADNELTACRSSGISYMAMTAPALVLGLIVALMSLVFLCFVVPVCTLQVEKVIYSNLAQLVQNEIEKTHQLKLEDFSVAALHARVLEPDPQRPNEQRVELEGPMIVTYILPPQTAEPGRRMRSPAQFWTAKVAMAYIEQKADEVDLEVVLSNGTKFPRLLAEGPHSTVGTLQFGPVPFPSPIKEDPKFMDIRQLKEINQHPENSARLRDLVKQFVKQDQRGSYLEDVVFSGLQKTGSTLIFHEDNFLRLFVLQGLSEKGSFTFTANKSSGPSDVQQLTVIPGGEKPVFPEGGGELILRSGPKLISQKVKIEAHGPGGEPVSWEGRELHIRAEAVEPMQLTANSWGPPRMAVTFMGYDTLEAKAPTDAASPTSSGAATDPATTEAGDKRIASFVASMVIPMPRQMWMPDRETGEDFSERTLTLSRGDEPALISSGADKILLRSSSDHDARQVKLVLRHNGLVESTWESREMVLKAEPEPPPRNAPGGTSLLKLSVSGYDVLIGIPEESSSEQPLDESGQNSLRDSPEEADMAQHKTFRTELTIPMPDSLQKMETQDIRDFKVNRYVLQAQSHLLEETTDRLTHKLKSEIHSRASLSISCLVLVMIGCTLGLMFRSGNFLSAFAVSFIPAMLSIALIVTGQQVCSRVAHGMGLGLGFIWGGNAVVALLALVLLIRLQRQ